MCTCRALRCESALSYGAFGSPLFCFQLGTECSLLLLRVSPLSSPGLKKIAISSSSPSMLLLLLLLLLQLLGGVVPEMPGVW